MTFPYRYLSVLVPLPFGALIHFSLKRKLASASDQDIFDAETLQGMADSWIVVTLGFSALILVSLLIHDISEWIFDRREKTRIQRILAKSDE